MTCPAIWASVGKLSPRVRSGESLRTLAVPITSTRSAPRCSAGLTGAIWRIEPSPKNSRFTLYAGKRKGIALDAMRCSTRMPVLMPIRCERCQPSSCSEASKKLQLWPDV